MKKRFLFPMMLLASLFLCSCDGNFGIKTLYCTYLVINDVPKDSEITLFCKSEKIGITELTKCEKVIDEKILEWARRKELIDENVDFVLFDIPSIRDIEDRNNINIYLKTFVNNEAYTGEIYIKSLKEDSNAVLFKEPVTLKTEDNKKLDAIFGYEFWRSI